MEGAAPAQSQTMLPRPPPSALAPTALPGSAGPFSMPEGSAPHSAAPGLNLLAFLQSSGECSDKQVEHCALWSVWWCIRKC